MLIFYAGHGVQLQGQNYLLPVDTPDPESMETITAGAIKLNDVIARFSNRDRQTFLFLDSCRNNPMAGLANVSNGLAQVEVGENTFVAFATQPGNVTVDGVGSNSPFTTALLKNVEIPGLSISDMMIRVRNETEAVTAGQPGAMGPVEPARTVLLHRAAGARPDTAERQPVAHPGGSGAKERLQVELASNDLQTAVLIVGQTLRSVDVDPQPRLRQPARRNAGRQPVICRKP